MSIMKTSKCLADGEVQYDSTATTPDQHKRETLVPLTNDGTAVRVALTAPSSSRFSNAGTLTDHSGTITLGGTAQTVMSANTSRKYLLIENVSSGNLWINFTTTANQNQPSFVLTPNGSFVMESTFISTELVSIIGATTGQAFTAKEG